MDGTEGERAHFAREFAGMIEERTHLEVVMQDERLTTAEAREIIGLTGNYSENPKGHIDAMAAAIILTDHINQPEFPTIF